MNNLLLPPSPNWYETDIMACAPDNTLIYGSRQDIVVIKPTPEDKPDDVQIISKAHSMRIKSININRNWGEPHKYAVTVSEDKVVKLWDIESLEKRLSHNKHISQDDDTKVVGASFAGDDRVISTSEAGTIVIWNITKNEPIVLSSLFDAKTTVTCLSVCPHATWLAAVGLKSGLIIVIDLRRTGKVLYKLRGHNKSVVSLSWCPAPVNIFPVKPNNKVVEKSSEKNNESVIVKTSQKVPGCNDDNNTLGSIKECSGDIEKEIEELSTESLETSKVDKGGRVKQKYPKKAPNPWVGLVYADDEPEQAIKEINLQNDYLKECADVRQHILEHNTSEGKGRKEEISVTQESAPDQTRVILKPKNKKRKGKLADFLLKKEQTTKKHEDQAASSQETPKEEDETVDTPTDRREISMEISESVEKLGEKLTDNTEKSMELTSCGREGSTNTVDSDAIKLDTTSSSDEGKNFSSVSSCNADRKEKPLPSVDRKESSSDAFKLDTTSASDEGKFSSVSSCNADGKEESSSDAFKLDTTSSSDEGKIFSSVSSCDVNCTCSKDHKGIPEKQEIRKSDTSSTSEYGDVFHDALVCDITGNKERTICTAEELVRLEEQPRREFLLASSAREPNIYIWRAGTDGRMQSFMIVPPIKNVKKVRPDKIWITLCWVAPNMLLSSSRGAELLQWTLPRPMDQTKFITQIHRHHWSVLFSIKAPILYLNEYNFLQKRDINAWTTGMDRTILNTAVGSQKNLCWYHALGGSVNCFSGSPLDPNRLAFGSGEGVLHVWDLSSEHKKRIVFSTFYQKISASVTALAWHPLIETSLAFATVEGRIGILDTVAKSKSPKLLGDIFKSQVFKIEWGPGNGDIKKPALFVVGEAKVAVFDPKVYEKEPQLLELPDNTSVYTMSWKPDYSFLLVSSKSGSLITYTPDLRISNVAYVRHKLQSIIWNPNAASNDTSVSKYCQTFVSIVKHTQFVVYDLSIQSDNYDEKVVAHFENRDVLINSIEWNPHCGNQLVLVDDGGVAQVYDIETKTVLSTYVNPWLDPLLAAYWSPVDQDYIISGSIGHKIIVWKLPDNPPLTDKEINTMKNKITKAQSKEAGDQLTKAKVEVTSTNAAEASKLKRSTKSQILPMFYNLREKDGFRDIRKVLLRKLGDLTVESNIGDNKNIDVLEIFDDQNDMERLLNLNIALCRQKGQHHSGNLLTLFKGDVSTAIKEAIDQKRVNPWIISMCPMVSPKLWQTACETYADQLQEEPEADPLEIVTYLLACHKVEESVEVLCERGMFREALVLAKARFGANNSVVPEILHKWAKNLVFHGNLELAALCFISIEKFEEAASALFRRSSVELLELAVDLAKLSGNEELHKAVLFRFNAFKTHPDVTKESSKILNGTNQEDDQDNSKKLLPEETSRDPQVQKETNYLESRDKLLCALEKTSDNESNLIEQDSNKIDSESYGLNKNILTEIKNGEFGQKAVLDNKEPRVDNGKEISRDCKEYEDKDIVQISSNKKDDEKEELASKSKDSMQQIDGHIVVKNDGQLSEVELDNCIEKAKDIPSETAESICEDSNTRHNKEEQDESQNKVDELLLDSVKLDKVAEQVLNSQERLLETMSKESYFQNEK